MRTPRFGLAPYNEAGLAETGGIQAIFDKRF